MARDEGPRLMLGVGRDYVSLDAHGDNEAVFARMREIGDAIAEAFGDTVSYRVKRLSDVERIEEEMRDPPLIMAASGGQLPVLLVHITDPTGERGEADFAPLVARFGLRAVGGSPG